VIIEKSDFNANQKPKETVILGEAALDITSLCQLSFDRGPIFCFCSSLSVEEIAEYAASF